MNTNECRFTGNLAADPEYKVSDAGVPRATFRIGITKRLRNDRGGWEDGPTTWIRCVAWGRLADNIAATLRKGTRATVCGDLRQRSYTDKDGVDRTTYELNVTQAAPDLAYATAQVTANPKGFAGRDEPEPEF